MMADNHTVETIEWFEKRLEEIKLATTGMEKAIESYVNRMASEGVSPIIRQRRHRQLDRFFEFVKRKRLAWHHIFTFDSLASYQKTVDTEDTDIVVDLSRHLAEENKIPDSLEKKTPPLPEICQSYLDYYAQSRQPARSQLRFSKRIILALHTYLEKSNTPLKNLTIDHIDAFLAVFSAPLALSSRRHYRTHLRRYLTYLHHYRGILTRDLAPLIVGPASYAQAKPPKFLRADEVARLFAAAKFETALDLRTHAMLHLAYTLGLRPREISMITLDDIDFSEGQLRVMDRKSNSPVKLPLPEQTVKAVSAYIIGGRVNSSHRALFLDIVAPHNPVKPGTVSRNIRDLMRAAGLTSTAYWLRHTYAQNLLESGASIFEIKQMMGHDRIQTTKRYLHIHTKMMREVLFDEGL